MYLNGSKCSCIQLKQSIQPSCSDTNGWMEGWKDGILLNKEEWMEIHPVFCTS